MSWSHAANNPRLLAAIIAAAACLAPARISSAAEADDVWAAFLTDFHNAGKRSVEDARAILSDQRPRLLRLGRDVMMSSLEKAVRDAKFVDDTIDEGLRGARGFVRFTHEGRSVSGKVLDVSAARVRIRTAVGKTIDLERSGLSPPELVDASGLLRYKLATPLQVGAYYLVRGDLRSAAGILESPADGAAERQRASYAALVKQVVNVTGKKPEVSGEAEPPPPQLDESAPREPELDAQKPRAKARVPRTGGPYEPDALSVLLLHFDEDEDEDETNAAPADSSPTSAELVEAKDVTRVRGVAARHGAALRFNGASSSLFLRSEGKLSITEPAITVEAWVHQYDRFAGNLGAQDIVTQGENTGYHLGLIRGRLFFSVMMDGVGRVSVGDAKDDMIEIPADTWVHVAGTYDGRALKLFVDGEQQAHYTFNGKPAPPPDEVIVGSRFSGVIDEVRISKTIRTFAGLGRVDRGETGRGLPNLALVQDIAARFDASRVSPKSIVTVGGAVAGHKAFDQFVSQKLDERSGYTLLDKGSLTGKRVGIEDGLAQLRSRFEDVTPEVVRVCFGPYDLAKNRSVEELHPRLRELTQFVLDRGAVPVLYTLPMPIIAADQGGTVINEYNRMVRSLAVEMRVPIIDALMILNDPGARGKKLLPTGTPTREGYQALSEKFVELYQDLEYWVMARGEYRVTSVAAADRAAAEAAAESVPREPRPKGNLVTNGGFESVAERSDFARGWTSHQWGAPGAKHSCRVDQMERHSGARSLLVRGLTDDAKSGAFTSVSLHEGPYEVRFWVSAEVDEGQTAQVFARLGGHECDVVEVGAEWTRVVHRVEIEDRQLAASLGLWTTAVRVRVWFDDVEVEAVE